MSALRQQLQVFVEKELSPAAMARKLAQVADEGAARLIAEGRASPRFQRFVNGSPGTPVDRALPDAGYIVHEFTFIGEAVVFAVEYLQERLPAKDGKLRNSLTVSVEGRPIRLSSLDPEKIPPDATILIYANQPYSRKADVQLIGKQPLRFNKPAGSFADAAAAVRSRFGNTLHCQRLYSVSVPNQWRRQHGQVGRLVEYPALEISARG